VIRTWHDPEMSKFLDPKPAARPAAASDSTRPAAPTPGTRPAPTPSAPVPDAQPTAPVSTVAANPTAPAGPPSAPPTQAKQRRPFPDDDLGWLKSKIGTRVEVTLLSGEAVHGILRKVSRYELLVREDRRGEDRGGLLVMKHAVATVREVRE